MLAKGVTILSDRTREIRGRPDDEGDGLVQARNAMARVVLDAGRWQKEMPNSLQSWKGEG